MKLKATLLFFALTFGLCASAQEPFKVRAMHIDLRSQVMTPVALRNLVDMSAAQGLNTLIMEWESTFPYERNAVLRGPFAYSKDEIKDFVDYAASKGVDIIPLQNCFGHSEYILRHERYMGIREVWNKFDQVCPRQIGKATSVFESIFKEIADAHPSKYIHIGADETRSLGSCKRCQKYLETHTMSDLFCEYVASMCKIVRQLGKTPVIWGDILVKYPDAVDKLPKDLVVMDWNYGWAITHFGDIDRVLASGLEVWGAPALRCYPDNYFLVQWDKHFRNLDEYIPYCREKGFKGVVNTSWSTSGQYGNIIELDSEVISMVPEREVYPLSAFRILQEAYAEAIRTGSYESHAFVRRYCSETFGFEGEDLDNVCGYFFTPQENVSTKLFKEDVILKETETAQKIREMMHSLKPKKGREEFAHFVLMSDIRVNYLRFKLIDFYHESPAFDSSKAGDYSAVLAGLIKEQKSLQKRFNKLNEGYLKHPEEYYGKWSYTLKMKELKRIFDNM